MTTKLSAAFAIFMFINGISIASAQHMYVGDTVRVGVRSTPEGQDAPLVVIETGDRVEVLGSAGNHYRVRTAGGQEGWVRKRYLSAEMPARLLLQQRPAVPATETGRSAAVQQPLPELTRRNAELQQQNDMLRHTGARPGYNRIFVFAGILIAALGGFVSGQYWYRQRIMKKLGGLSF